MQDAVPSHDIRSWCKKPHLVWMFLLFRGSLKNPQSTKQGGSGGMETRETG